MCRMEKIRVERETTFSEKRKIEKWKNGRAEYKQNMNEYGNV